MRSGRWKYLGVVGATLPLWIPASARMTNSVVGDNYFRTNDEKGDGNDEIGRSNGSRIFWYE